MPIVHLKNSAGVITEYTVTPPQTITGLAAGTYEFTEGLTKRNVTVTASGGGTPTPTPSPTFASGSPFIQSDGTPQVGETLTGVATVNNGTVTAHAWLANGSVINGATSSTYVPATEGSYAYRATATGASGTTPATATSSPVTVTAASTGAPTLGALTLSPNTGTVGTAYTGTISGKTANSTLDLSGAGAAGLSVSGTTVSGTPTTAGSVNIVETLAGATGSPRTSTGVLTVAAAGGGTPPAGSFIETFTAPDGTDVNGHTSDSGHIWTVYSGTFAIAANRAHPIATGVALSSYLPSTENYRVENPQYAATVQGNSGLVIRAQDELNFYVIAHASGWQLFKMTNGSLSSALNTSGLEVPTTGSTVNLAVDIKPGGVMDFYSNGVLLFSRTDAAIPVIGKVGMRRSLNAATSTTGIHWDSFAAFDVT